MLKRQKPTLPPNRFKNNDLKNLSESILNVCNKSILVEQLVLPTTVSNAVTSAVLASGSSTGTQKKKPDRDGDGVPDDEDAAPDSKNYDGDAEKNTTGTGVPARIDPAPAGPVLPNVKSAEDLKSTRKSPLTPVTNTNNTGPNVFGASDDQLGGTRERGKPNSFQGGGFRRGNQAFGPKEKTQSGDIMFAQRDYAIPGDPRSSFALDKKRTEKVGNVDVMKNIGQPAKDYLAKTGTAKQKFSMPGYDLAAAQDYVKDQADFVAATTALAAGAQIPAGLGPVGILAGIAAGKNMDIAKGIQDFTSIMRPGQYGAGSTAASPLEKMIDPSNDTRRFTNR
jgi:hypothetical protein